MAYQQAVRSGSGADHPLLNQLRLTGTNVFTLVPELIGINVVVN